MANEYSETNISQSPIALRWIQATKNPVTERTRLVGQFWEFGRHRPGVWQSTMRIENALVFDITIRYRYSISVFDFRYRYSIF